MIFVQENDEKIKSNLNYNKQTMENLRRDRQVVERHAQKLRMLKHETQILEKKISYYQSVQSYIDGCTQYIKKNTQNKTTDLNNKIKRILSTIQSPQPKQHEIPPPSNCKNSIHLQQILSENNLQTKSQILEKKLKMLYNTIEQILLTEEPFICQKILSRIKKQAKRQSKLKLLNQISQQIKKFKNWLGQSVKKIEEEAVFKEIEHLTILNLSKMKQIMNEKISINDYLFDLISNSESHNLYLPKIHQLRQRIQKQFRQYSENIEQTVRSTNIQQMLIQTQNQHHTDQLVTSMQELSQSIKKISKKINSQYEIRCKQVESRIRKLQQLI